MTELPPLLPPDAPHKPFDRLCWIMEKLLGPGGCPWDREQTHESLKQYLIEEAYEVCEAIETGDAAHLREELGDVVLQVVFHSALAKNAGAFDVDGVLDGICEKLVRRHPHVFGSIRVADSGEVLQNWERIKQRERTHKQADNSLVAGIPASLPALQKATRMQNKVRRVGFDWPDASGAIEKVREEFDELVEELEKGTPQGEPTPRQIEEFGDVLFSLANVARLMGIRAEEALQAACAKFAQRFRHLEKRAEETGRKLQDMTLEEMDTYWEEAKTL